MRPVLASVGVFIGLLLIFNALRGWIFGYTVKPFPIAVRRSAPLLRRGYMSATSGLHGGDPASC